MKLGIFAAFLVLVAIVGFALEGTGNVAPAIVGVLAIFLLLELPGAWWMMRGGPVLPAGASIYAPPLVIFEVREYISWVTYCPCGDKEIQPFLMLYVYPFFAAVTGTIVLVCALTARRRPAE